MPGSTVRARLRHARGAQQGEDRPGNDGYVPQRPQLQEPRDNPLADIVDDATYRMLAEFGLLVERRVRDHCIRITYRKLRASMSSNEVMEVLCDKHPNLEYDTIRKIVYAPLVPTSS